MEMSRLGMSGLTYYVQIVIALDILLGFMMWRKFGYSYLKSQNINVWCFMGVWCEISETEPKILNFPMTGPKTNEACEMKLRVQIELSQLTLIYNRFNVMQNKRSN